MFKSSGLSRINPNQRDLLKGGGGVSFNFRKGRKRKSDDYPNVFDHLAVLQRKQLKYQEERYCECNCYSVLYVISIIRSVVALRFKMVNPKMTTAKAQSSNLG